MRRGPTYRIANKIFAMERPQGESVAVWCKALFVPPYVGPKGWIGMTLDRKVDWQEVAALVERSYRLIAPKRPRR